MSIRRDPIYISSDVWRSLFTVARSQEKTPDELADELLAGVIRDRYPGVINYLKAVHALEKDIIKTLGGSGK